MKCPKCKTDNPKNAKFCIECGHNFSIPHKKTLQELSIEQKIDKIQRYLPKGLAEKILSQRGKIEGEHKQITVMFCVGF